MRWDSCLVISPFCNVGIHLAKPSSRLWRIFIFSDGWTDLFTCMYVHSTGSKSTSPDSPSFYCFAFSCRLFFLFLFLSLFNPDCIGTIDAKIIYLYSQMFSWGMSFSGTGLVHGRFLLSDWSSNVGQRLSACSERSMLLSIIIYVYAYGPTSFPPCRILLFVAWCKRHRQGPIFHKTKRSYDSESTIQNGLVTPSFWRSYKPTNNTCKPPPYLTLSLAKSSVLLEIYTWTAIWQGK